MSPQTPEPLAQIADIQTRLLTTELNQKNLEGDFREKITQIEQKSKEYITRRETHYFFKDARAGLNRLNNLFEDYIKKQDEKEKKREERAEKRREMWSKIFIGVTTTLVGTGLIGAFAWIVSNFR